MEKIARARYLGYYLHSHTQCCRNRTKSFGGAVWYCSQANSDDDTQNGDKPSKLMAALKGLKVEKNVGQMFEKKKPMTFQNANDIESSKKPVVLEALREAVASLPESEKAEEELITELKRQDAESLAAKQIIPRPDRLQPDDEYKTQSVLLQRLRSSQQPDEVEPSNLTSIMSELKVQRPKEGTEKENVQIKDDGELFVGQFNGEAGDAKQFRSLQTKPYERQRKRSLFGRHRLNIFETTYKEEHVPMKIDTKASIWDVEEQRTLNMLRYASVSNGFDEMSMLTEQGRLWQYPVNNEQGMEVEVDVGFHEHIFLDTHINAFPAKGPIRHFMELVAHGLSLNPYLTVRQKRDNIQWFYDYFKNKEGILKETGAIEKEFIFV